MKQEEKHYSIKIAETQCPHCGKVVSTRFLRFLLFDKTFLPVNEEVISRWSGKCCYLCKAEPKVGEVWGLTIGYKEKNRPFCPTCAEKIEEMTKGRQHETKTD